MIIHYNSVLFVFIVSVCTKDEEEEKGRGAQKFNAEAWD
jgi:hypothetical protein